jgi:hypothetical protein
MATISNTPRPGYVWDATDNVWYPIGVGAHQHTNAADTPAVMPYSTYAAAGKNKILNGDFGINQRNFTSNTTNNDFNFDRWQQVNAGGTFTVTPQVFTPGAAPVTGYEGVNFLRGVTASQSAASDRAVFRQKIENVRTFTAQNVTISFWAKAGSGTPKIGIEIGQTFVASSFNSVVVSAVTLSTSWTRYSATVAIPSVSGKTITPGNSIDLFLWLSAGSDWNSRSSSIGIQSNTFDIWGVQVEAGSNMTAFETATGNPASELAACQRYYQKSYDTGTAPATNLTLPGIVFSQSGDVANLGGVGSVTLKTEMRVAPTVTIYSYTSSQTGRVSNNGGTDLTASSGVANYIGTRSFEVQNSSGATLTATFNGFLFHYVASSEL